MDFGTALTSLGGTACAAFMAYLYYRYELKKKELQKQEADLKHLERLKALELGLPLTDVEIAKAQAESSRAWAAGTVGLLVVPGSLIIALVATLMLLSWQSYMSGSEAVGYDLRQVPPILYAIWGVCGLVSMMTAIMSMAAVATAKGKAGDKSHIKSPNRSVGEEFRVGARS